MPQTKQKKVNVQYQFYKFKKKFKTCEKNPTRVLKLRIYWSIRETTNKPMTHLQQRIRIEVVLHM